LTFQGFRYNQLAAIRIWLFAHDKEKTRRCPDHIKAVKPARVFLYVSFDGKEVLVNELGSFLICIRLGIQPSTRSSSRSCAEIQQDGAGLFLWLRFSKFAAHRLSNAMALPTIRPRNKAVVA
jgi:hypothetical protein